MFKVCDSMMGSGKSSAVINHMKDHPNQRFVYITPYIEEADRIAAACPELRFVTPSNKLRQYGYSKLRHTAALLEKGRNIATTHAAFQLYTKEMIEDVRRREYTLICDETIDVMVDAQYSAPDFDLLFQGGYLKKSDDGMVTLGERKYCGSAFSSIFTTLKYHDMVCMPEQQDRKRIQLFYWLMPMRTLSAFRDVYILTYLFDGQELKYYLALSGVTWENIGVQIIDGKHRFVNGESALPEYAGHLRELIHVCDNDRMNRIGENKHALSRNWFVTADDGDIHTLKCNLYNFVHNIMHAKSGDVLWTTLDSARTKVLGRGYSKGYISYIQRATNKYRDRTVLAYLINVFSSPVKARYFNQSGLEFDDDKFALSVLIQWIWRSAIRDGKEIWLYLPSRRMRRLLFDWIDEVEAAYRKQTGAAPIIAA